MSLEINSADSIITSIYKFHGDFNNDDSLVLTETSYYDRMEFEDPLDIRLRSDILNNTLLLLGYSLGDINTRYIFYKLHKINQDLKPGNKSYSAIMTTFGMSEIQKSNLANWNIQVHELEPVNRNKSMSDFLKSLQ